MSLSKETLEAASPAAKTSAPAAQSKPDLNRLRADAVSLDVPVRVHGSRVKEVVRGVTPHTEPFEEEASTMIVFPHGGVVRMATAVGVGQMLVLTNLRTNQDAICRVVKVRAYSNSQAYVEVEFTHRQAGYWGVHFPADDDESFSAAAPPAPAAPEPEKKPVVSSMTVKVEAMPKIPASAARNESAFAQIGSQEDVQPAAAHTEVKAPASPIAPPRTSMPTPLGKIAQPPVSKMAAPVHSIEPMEPEASATESAVEIEEPRASRTFGTLTGGTGGSAQSAVTSDFGARLDMTASAHAQAAGPRSNNWIWIAACLFFLVAGLAGGAFYFRQHSTEPQGGAQGPGALSQPAAPAAPAAVTQSPTAQPVMQADENIASTSAPTATIAEHQSRSVTSAPEQPSRFAENGSARESRPTAPAVATPSSASKNFAPTNARPVARAIETGRVDTAPAVTAAPTVTPNASEALPGVFNSSEAAPPPPPQPLTRVRVGGVIVQPKLVHSVAPNYPSAARNAGISGNVVIVAHVDKTGAVASMKVVSGPATLQSAAMSALKNWKYEPATLDGAPIPTDVTVTIKFQQQ